ncbi:stalk domain-containing protein [Paenibacillus alvei]|uniref:stalk domain-containing protein n=1 Tax=Paenibacillus alvei TaxID=44250 RepID=UPI0018CD0CB5|nr:stalk domain-containing protein [Paenibacillus alvei]MBG9735077.1 copper amine oxidase [Paenibacillus alvei]MBG9743535.1 copper amine oxidase [Paenibacillus alvei]MCY9579925.1 stalk domain-containing protein [Paenibacillus alvei]MCY9584102.1 stalk domain-containing protein [Paenibacillus alvei]
MGKSNYSVRHKHTRRFGTKAAAVVLSGALFIQPALGWGSYVYADAPIESSSGDVAPVNSLQKISEEVLTSGARLVTYQYTLQRGSKTYKTRMNMIEADLRNPYIKLDVMTGKNGKTATGNPVTKMSKETGAVAGVNGDYWMMGSDQVPMGGSISEGVMITSPAELTGMYAFAVTKSGTPTIDQYRFTGSVALNDGQTFPLSGINKMKYDKEPGKQHSHMNALYVYTSAWSGMKRPNDTTTTPTEVLVRNGVVEQISDMAALPIEVPEDGVILRGHGQAADFMRRTMEVGTAVKIDYRLTSQTSGQAVDPSSFQMMISGHTLLVENGKASSFTRDTSGISGSGVTARTAVGYSKDGRYAYIVTAESNSVSSGFTLKEFQQALVQAGVWKAVNLDGGGSTTMTNRPLGEFDTKLTHETKEGGNNVRSVVNGLGVFTTAPTGKVKGMTLSGEKMLFVGQRATYSMKAYDEYYNPVDASNLDVKWSSADGKMKWDKDAFVAQSSGKATIVATTGGAKTTAEITVIGAKDLSSLQIATSSAPLTAGASVPVPIKATLLDGNKATVPASAIKWELRGFNGKVVDGVLRVDSVPAGTKIGYAIASYDGLKTMIPVTLGAEKQIDSFNQSSTSVSFSGLPKGSTKGQASIEGGFGGRGSNDKVIKLSYDMKAGGNADKFAYAELNGSTGIDLPSGTSGLKFDVYGDKSFNNLRLEIHDANKKAHYVNVAESINWDGWKKVEVDLSSLGISYPAKLKRLYLVNFKEDQDERATEGAVAFDNLTAQLPAGSSDIFPSATMNLTVNSKSSKVNGDVKKMDVAPIVLNGSTYVPVRVVLDAFGGEALWNGSAQSVTIMRGERFLEMIVNQKGFVRNGSRLTSDVAPIIRQGRTLVPLRFVSEQLGLTVKWDQNTKSITIH